MLTESGSALLDVLRSSDFMHGMVSWTGATVAAIGALTVLVRILGARHKPGLVDLRDACISDNEIIEQHFQRQRSLIASVLNEQVEEAVVRELRNQKRSVTKADIRQAVEEGISSALDKHGLKAAI